MNVWHVYIRRDGTIATPEDIAKERAAKRAEEERTHRSAQSGEATSAALLAETTAPRLRAAAVRLSRMPSKPKPQNTTQP